MYKQISKVLTSTLVLICCGSLIACASNSHKSLPQSKHVTPSISQLTQYVRGQLLDKQGHPIKAATVYFPKHQTNAKKLLNNYNLGSISIKSNGCKQPTLPYYSFTCTDSNGRFHLHMLGYADLPLQLSFINLNKSMSITLDINDISTDLGQISFEQTQLKRNKIAVVMDLFNPLEHMSSLPGLNPYKDSEQFARRFFEYYHLSKYENELLFPELSSLFKDTDGDNKADIYLYKTVYINSRGEQDMHKLGGREKTLLLEYVSNGGELLITNWGATPFQITIEQFI